MTASSWRGYAHSAIPLTEERLEVKSLALPMGREPGEKSCSISTLKNVGIFSVGAAHLLMSVRRNS